MFSREPVIYPKALICAEDETVPAGTATLADVINPNAAICPDEDTIEELDEVKKPLSVNCDVEEIYELVLDCNCVIALLLVEVVD